MVVIGGLSQRIYHGGARVRTPPIIPATLERVGSGTPWSFVVRRSRAGARMFGISDQLWFEKSVVFSGTPTPHLSFVLSHLRSQYQARQFTKSRMAAALIAAAGGGSGKPRLPTPDTGHLGAAEFDKVYEPVEVHGPPPAFRTRVVDPGDPGCGMRVGTHV